MLIDLVEANCDGSSPILSKEMVHHRSFMAGVLRFDAQHKPELIHQWLEIPMSQTVKTSCLSSSLVWSTVLDDRQW